MSRTKNTAVAAALSQRARLALEIARHHDSDCDAATAFCLATGHPHWGVDRLQKAIRSQTRRERGHRVFTPPWVMPASGLPLTADLGRSAGAAERHHLDDPADLVELVEFMEALANDPAAIARLEREDELDELARHATSLAAKALGLSRRRAQQMRRAALTATHPQRAWAELVWLSADRATAHERRRKAARARRRQGHGGGAGQLSLLGS